MKIQKANHIISYVSLFGDFLGDDGAAFRAFLLVGVCLALSTCGGGGSIASGGDWQGASGYLPCSFGTDALLAALQMVAAGEVYVPVEMMADDSPITLRSQGWLTGRERDILNGLLSGQ